MKELDYTVVSSGSKGNCVVIENVMIDCGIPFIKLKEYLYEVDFLLITHKHGDHINKSTYKKIRKEFPNIITISNYEVARDYEIDEIVTADFYLDIGEYSFLPFEGKHDVLTYGYTWYFDDLHIIYATDMHDFNLAPSDDKYDYLFLESNYDKKKLELVKGSGKRKYGYDVYSSSSQRHASTQHCMGFYFNNRRSKDSKLIELHKSSRFY